MNSNQAAFLTAVTSAGLPQARVPADARESPNRGAAAAWMATDQYAQLKALLVSVAYA